MERVEVDHEVSILGAPNDPFYDSQGSWGQPRPDLHNLHQIRMARAWDRATGSEEVTIAVIDSGIDDSHPDLGQNMWTNPGEVPGNGVDDDGNGYVDDIKGWNFFANSNDTRDPNGHGTHVAGIAAARGNNRIGVVGIAQKASLMPLRFILQHGRGTASDAIVAMRYAADMGADVALNAWGCECMSQAIDDAVRYMHQRGVVVVAASGNQRTNVMRISPASATDAITVTATDWRDKPAFYNRGMKVDVAAPGRGILSTRSGRNSICNHTVATEYCVANGSSMAAAHVAGLAALLRAANPRLSPEGIRQLIRSGARDVGRRGRDGVTGFGRIDAARTLRRASTNPLAPYLSSPRGSAAISGRVLVEGRIRGARLTSFVVRFRPAGGRWITLARRAGQHRRVSVPLRTKKYPNGAARLRLVAFTRRSRAVFELHALRVMNPNEPFLERGFPAQGGPVPASSYHAGPALLLMVGDIDPDPQLEILLAGQPLHAWNHDGSRVEGWPPPDGLEGTSYPALAEFQSDNGGLEVATAIWGSEMVTAYSGGGQTLAGWPRNAQNYVATPPAAADVDGDGVDEIFLDEQSGELSGRTADGTFLEGWPSARARSQEFDTPAIGDLDGDGDLEVVAVNGGQSRLLYAWHHSGALAEGFPVEIGRTEADAFPMIGDVDGDDQIEIVVLVLTPMETDDRRPPLKNSILVFSATGELERRILLGMRSFNSPTASLADLTGDGTPEIVVQEPEALHVLEGASGFELPGWPIRHEGRGATDAVPVVGDLDGNGEPDVVTIFGNEVQGFDRFGRRLDRFPFAPKGARAWRVAMADIDLDGRNELIVSGKGRTWRGQGRVDLAWAYDFRGSGPYGQPEWGQFGGGPKHQGTYPVTDP